MPTKKKFKQRSVYQIQWGLKNYMNKHNIHAGNENMQTVIINSFYIHIGGDNSAPWDEKVKVTQEHFGLFAQYVNNNWKTK